MSPKQKLWKAYVAKNPSFEGGGNVTMSRAGLRKLFDQTYDMGMAEGRAVEANEKSLFERIFGKH